jgi:hypothetical protein
MSLAWAPIAVLVLLLPGVFFFIGLATFERLSREIIRSSVISEVAMAVVIAIAIHTLCIVVLSAAVGFRLSDFTSPLLDYTAHPVATVEATAKRLLPFVIYLFVTTLIGFGFGCLVAWGVVTGWMRFLATHQWIYDIIKSNRKDRFVTAFIMTTLVENNKVLMYRGRVHEFFLQNDGTLAYIILKNCSRYHMSFEGDKLETSKQYELFGPKQADRSAKVWDRLFIDGTNIANVLFDPSPEVTITKTPEGSAALDAAVARRRQELRERIMATARARIRAELEQQNKSPQSN